MESLGRLDEAAKVKYTMVIKIRKYMATKPVLNETQQLAGSQEVDD